MLKPIGLQLYTLRDLAAKDFASVLKKVADIGYIGIEPAGVFNIRPSEFKKMADDLGLKIFSSHTPWAVNPNTIGEAMEIADILGQNKLACGYGRNDFEDLDAIKRTAERTMQIYEIASQNGFTLFQHNHDFEFERIDGKLKYEIYKELCPQVKYEMDCFWSTNHGQEDPVEMLKIFADSTILLHMKDGICDSKVKTGQIVLRALGQGDLPIPELIKNMPDAVESIIVELDFCNIDMLEAVELSYKYLTENKLAKGNK